MEPIDYIRALIRRWPIIAVASLLGALFFFVGTDPKPAPIEVSYRATNTLLVNQAFSGSQTLVGSITMAQVPVFATSGEVPRRVAAALKYQGSPPELATQVSVNIDTTQNVVTFTSVGNDPQRVKQIADTFAETTIAYLVEKQASDRNIKLETAQLRVSKLEADLKQRNQGLNNDGKDDPVQVAQRDATQQLYQSAYQNLLQLQDADSADVNLTPQEAAEPIRQETNTFTLPRTRKERVPLGALVGAVLGAVVALLVERLDSRIRDRRRAEESFNASVLSEVPVLARHQRGRRVLVGPSHHHPVAEVFRSLRTSVTFLATGGEQLPPDQPLGVMLVCSPGPAEGKTTTALNLAAAFAETGRDVVLINADFRRPAVTKAVVTGDRPPLPGGLLSVNRLAPDDFLIDTDLPGVRLLDLAPLAASAGDLTRATAKIAEKLRELADVIIIDTPPLEVTTEALEFVPMCDVVLMVARVGMTSTESAKRAAELIRFAGANHVGVCLIAAPGHRTGGSKYYDYYADAGKRGWRKNREVQHPVELDAFDDEPFGGDGDERGELARPRWSLHHGAELSAPAGRTRTQDTAATPATGPDAPGTTIAGATANGTVAGDTVTGGTVTGGTGDGATGDGAVDEDTLSALDRWLTEFETRNKPGSDGTGT